MAEVDDIPEQDEPEPAPLHDDSEDTEAPETEDAGLLAEPPHPVNWNLLTAEEAAGEWVELDKWVTWLRHTYGLPASVVPPFWHRHPELVWDLSVCDRAGLTGLHFHELRHTFATLALESRALTMYELSVAMGHESEAVTNKVYAHLRKRDYSTHRAAFSAHIAAAVAPVALLRSSGG